MCADSNQVLKIYIFGDSIAFGQHIPVHETWVVKVSQGLNNTYRPRGVQLLFQNPSICGNTTHQALDRMNYDVIQHRPEILVIQFGLNDCNYWLTDNGVPRVSPLSFAANIQEMVIRGKNAGIKQIIVNTNHPTTRINQILPKKHITYQMSNSQYNQIIRDTVKTIDDDSVHLNDIEMKIEELLSKKKTSVRDIVLPEPDQLHLSLTGHMLYDQIMKEELIKVINIVI